jgi:DNA polymerase III subunit epsilon
MRQIVLDTETTGLEVSQGHRIIELAGVEIVNRRPSGKTFHRYVNPGRDIDFGAVEVHGLTLDFLQDKPKFRDVALEFLDFVQGAELIIHNAPFDVGFLDYELGLMDLRGIAQHCTPITDTLRMARDLHPGKRNSLDALCERYAVDNSARTLHGALLDAQLLAEVYLAMTRGQETLIIDLAPAGRTLVDASFDLSTLSLVVVQASDAELEAHTRQLSDIQKVSKGACVWMQLESPARAIEAAA